MIDETFEEIKLSGDMPSPAGVGMRILQIMRTDDYETDEIGQAIMTDPSLTGQILRVANSAANASVEPTTTVTEALMRLGSTCVRDLALAFSLVSDRSVGSCVAFDYERFWSLSLARAVVAKRLSDASGIGNPEEAYVCGLLGEVGELALASVFPDKYSALIEGGSMDDRAARREAEATAFKIDGAQVAASMLNDWGLPARFSEAIGTLASSSRIGARELKLDSLETLLRYADLMAGAFCLSKRMPVESWETLEKGLEMLGGLDFVKDSGSLDSFFDACVVDWVNWGKTLEVDTDKGVRYQGVVEAIEMGKQVGLTKASPRRVPPKIGGARPGSDPAPLRILVVEEAPELVNVLRSQDVLRDLNIESALIEDGLSAAMQHDPDMVLCRNSEHHANGLALCRTLRKSKLGTGVYFMMASCKTTEDFAVEAFEAGIDDLIASDASERLLMARIRGGMRLTQLQRKVDEDKRTMRKQMSELGILTRRLRSAALTDPLTELPNRRYAMKRLATEWETTSRTGRPLSVMMVDIDKFKGVNDTHGHDVGDLALKQVAGALRSSLRQADEICRIGGEEFLVICSHTDRDEAAMVAERLRRAVELCVIEADGVSLSLTISLGLAQRSAGTSDPSALLKAADEQVFKAKDSGRNCVCIASAPEARVKRGA
ncbi:MAG: two-component system cell cycle response regulator [Chlamydiales bacterium]|jgi:two-component system cell cycle response regulator